MSDEKLNKELKDEVAQIMQSVISRTRAYFEGEFEISLTETGSNAGHFETLTLLDMTAIIGMGGAINLLIAFSFQDGLINAMYERMTDGLGIQPDEVDMYREAAAGEAINTILGNCTIDLQELDGRGIAMTPPVILDQVKTIRRMKNAMFYTQNIDTALGCMTISLVGPRELFNTNLEYVK